ncbi:hypothetical protein KU306_02765 [Haloferax larsenii]|uniref:Halobacterial output domain-containing protein n=1 Tax=Haloferax larsenii TaxID=302484 RepID=A0ABY5RF94_HALLR|nr:HalOD1 output domain-containing protein [Haloferax larsenii]ELZ79530.1 hypothetical protein C455_08097 [Haloferax larsenii JCM 13917]UVE50829.1 hypothetical protein KU306_02765 [Haloferax larsenii]
MDEARVIQGSDEGWNTGTTDEVVARHDWNGQDTLAVTVVTATAEAIAVDALDLPPLTDVVNPDALGRLFHSPAVASMSEAATTSEAATSRETQSPSRGRVRFRYASCDVTIWADGTVIVTPAA